MTYQYRVSYTGPATPVKVQPLEPAVRPGPYRQGLKRVFDMLAVLLAAAPVLVVLLPLMLLIARDGHSPFYRQERVGRNGRTFRIWKLRSMVVNADQVLETCLAKDPAARIEWDHHQKLRHDPRVTRIGVVMRKTSIDELPQLWNVLVGEMSLVGPRPMMLSQRHLYPGTEYYAMRPGITGFWQISVRNESSFRERALFDRSYHQQLSFRTDLRVMLRTVGVVIKATGV